MQVLTFKHIVKPPAGSVCSYHASLIVPGVKPLSPVFVTADNLDVRWVEYEVLACIQHHGLLPTSGHYTAVLRRQGVSWHYDDEKMPVPLTTAGLDHLSTNVYVLFAKRSQVLVEPAASHTAPSTRHEHERVSASRSDLPHASGLELGGQSTVPAASSNRSSGDGAGDRSADSLDALHSSPNS